MAGNHLPNFQDQTKIEPMSALTLAFILFLGAAVRLVHVINLDFPLNDGGPFYQMILDIKNAGYALPSLTTYNLNQIPFAYPPLAFYAGAFLSDGLDWPVLDIIRILPAIISILTIPAFFLLSRRILNSTRQVLLATMAFSFLPTSFDWLIVGGGLTRSFGYLFAILTLWQVHALYTTERKRPIWLTILFASLTILSHPGTSWFTFYCTAVILAFHRKESKNWLLKSLWVIIGVLILTAPWWLTNISRHGSGVLTDPFQTEVYSLASFLTPFTFLFTNEPMLDILAVCGLLGVLTSLSNRSFFLPAWLLSIFLFEARLGATYSVLPMALLVGVGVDQGIWPLISPSDGKLSDKWARILPIITAFYLSFYVILNAYLGITYQSVTLEEIKTMQWIADNTPETSKFIILSGTSQYGIDHISEWFPALSQRTSLTTPQAHEWLPDREFTRRVDLHAELQELYLTCSDADLDCIQAWAQGAGLPYSHIYIPPPLPNWLTPGSQPAYEILYDSPGGLVLRRK